MPARGRMAPICLLALSLALPAAAQTHIAAGTGEAGVPAAPVPAAARSSVVPVPFSVVPAASFSAPSLSASAAPLPISAVVPSAASVSAVRAAPALAPSAAALVIVPGFEKPAASAALAAAVPAPRSLSPSAVADAVRPGDARADRAVATIERGAADWAPRAAGDLDAGGVLGAASDGAPRLARPTLAAQAETPVPPAPGSPRARPRAARAAFAAGAVLVAASAAAFWAPALVPAALIAAKGPALWAGFAALSLSRYWRAPSGAASARGPPAAEAKGFGATFKNLWRSARGGADAQAALEARVGGSSARTWRDWLLGGLRAAALWLPLAVAGLVAGRGLAQPFARFASPDAEGMIPFDSVLHGSLGGHLLGYAASSLSAQAATLAVFDGVRALAGRLGAGRAAPWLAGAAAMGVSAALVLSVTTAPVVVGPMLGIEAAALWLRARSKSWLAPLALRAALSLFSLEAARFGVHLIAGAAGVLAGLPAVWSGVAVAGLLLAALAWSAGSLRPAALWSAAKAQAARVREFGAAWRAPSPDGAPMSPWPLLKLGALGGLVLYACGDLVFSAIHAFAGGAEPTPALLVKMLTAPADLVLYNFAIVGVLEEFVFRRGLFKPLAAFLQKRGLSPRKVFWIAAVVSALIFSYAHYVDFGALLAKVGLADGAQAAGMGGSYAFSLAGFVTRAVLGVVLAWLYAASGTLLLPILAHMLADSFEGLGLAWGFGPFLAMAAGALLIQRVWKRGATQRP